MSYQSWCDYCDFEYKDTSRQCHNPDCPSNKITTTDNTTKTSEEIINQLSSHFINNILDFYKYYVDNPSAWKKFSQEGSDLIEEMVDRIGTIINANQSEVEYDFDVLNSL